MASKWMTWGVALGVGAGVSPALATTDRNDVADSLYTALGNNAAYASVGGIEITTNDPYSSSGVLISPKWVLTAGHVVAQDYSNTNYFRVGGSTIESGTQYSKASEFANPTYVGNPDSTQGYDIGLLQLTAAVTGITPTSRNFSLTETGKTGTDIGFGASGVGSTGVTGTGPTISGAKGTKRGILNDIDTTGTPFGYSANLLASDFDEPSVAHSTQIGSTVPLGLEGSIAEGDSGGGEFITSAASSRQYLAGVNVFTAKPNSSTIAGNASYGDFYFATKVSAFNIWIDDNTDNNWNTAGSGNFSDAGNWTFNHDGTHVAPTDGDIAGFNIASAAYTTTFTQDVNNYALLARQGAVTLDLATHSYSLTSTSYDGSLVVARYAGNNATVSLTNGTVNSHDVLIAQSSGATGTVNVGSAAALNVTGDVYVGGSVEGNGGAGTLSVQNSNSSLNVTGALNVYSGGVVNFNGGAFKVGNLAVAGQVKLGTGGGKVLRSSALSITGSGKVDLADNDMIVDGSPPSLDTVRSLIHTGYNGGAWNGNGLTTSSGDPVIHALGYRLAGSTSSFDGISGISSSALLVKYTEYGDTDLTGSVDNTDVNAFFAHYQTASGAHWTDGDFNYDGSVNSADFVLLYPNFIASGLTATPQFTALAQVLNLPEPTLMLSLFSAGAIVLRRRR